MSETKARIGILGGSFDPIHFGHIKPCLELAENYKLDSIRLIPCKLSPFKDNTFASAQHRWNMINVIAGSSELFVADSRELERETPSYTYDTLLELTEEFSQKAMLYWIMGVDALSSFPRWHKAEKIMQLCHILVVRRPGYELPSNKETQEWLKPYICDDFKKLEQKDFGHILITDTQMFDVSSTQIRETVQAGEQPRFLLPGGVWNYIKRNKLYVQKYLKDEKLL